VVIGPEGGWNKDEEELAFNAGFVGVSMGETILRTATAAVSASQVMTSWRRLKSSF
jgi:16S rRNA (uracil1498-N3)-methyltransferase